MNPPPTYNIHAYEHGSVLVDEDRRRLFLYCSTTHSTIHCYSVNVDQRNIVNVTREELVRFLLGKMRI